ncbi:hypothetical protein DH86_00003738, partial [Scytalidium sp. 3C]
SSSTPPSEPANVLDEKAPPQPEHVERIATFERVPGHTNYHEKNGLRTWIWFVLANLLSLAGVCPFVGSLSDLMGRRYVALIGALLIIVGVTVCSTAHEMNIFIGMPLNVVIMERSSS